jgi:NAD+ synthase (glutamine-hydrolysing)
VWRSQLRYIPGKGCAIRIIIAMKIALAQINPTVGDIAGNLRKIRGLIARAARRKTKLVVFPELCLSGYPPRDLVEQPHFVEANRQAVQQLATETGRLAVIVGYVDRNPHKGEKALYNAAAFLSNGNVQTIRMKTLLPNYDVFDEERHFAPAHSNEPIRFLGQRIGLTICEDMWHVPAVWPKSPYNHDPVAALAKKGCDFFINISASPFHQGKSKLRLDLVQYHAQRWHKPFLFVNQVGGNDEVLFDGHSFALDGKGRVLGQAAGFREDFIMIDTAKKGSDLWNDEPDIDQVRKLLSWASKIMPANAVSKRSCWV